jgi:antitoxin HigA-1
METIMDEMPTIHPGKILYNDFLLPLEITPYRLAKNIQTSSTRISHILRGNYRINADIALRLSIFFGNSPKYWLQLQENYDIEVEKRINKVILSSITKYKYENTLNDVQK